MLHWVDNSENSFKDHSVRLNEHRVLNGPNSGSTFGDSEDLCRNANPGIISAINFTVPIKLPMAHLAFSSDSREKRMQDCVGF